MALLSDDEVKLRISTETMGEASVEQLAQSIEQLAQHSGDAAPRFEALANEVRTLGQQQIRITGLEAAIASAKQAWSAVREARQEVQTLDKALADAKGAGANQQAIKLLEAELRAANSELAKAEKAWTRQKEQLDSTRAATAAAGVDTKNLAAEQARLASALADAGKAMAEQKASIEARNAAAAAQMAEEERLAQIVETTKTRQRLAAQELLAAELKAYAEAQSAAARATAQRAEEAAAVEAYANRTRKALADAFSVTGVRSSGAIQAEILAINQGLQKLAANAKVSGDDFDRAFASAQQRIAALRAEMAGGVDPFTQSVGRASGGLDSFLGKLTPMAGAIAAAFGVQQVAKMAADFDGLVRSMGAIAGSGSKAAQEVGYITEAASRLGLKLDDTAKAYTGWLASIRGTALEGEKGRQVFEAVAGSMARLGKSSEDTNGALLALGQMVSKGTVSMEELRGQLAERLPGALQAAADGAGITTAQLIKMVESGSVLAEDLLPGMAAQLQKLYGNKDVEGFTASWNKLTNAVSESIGRIGQTQVVMTAVGGTLGAVKEVVLVLGTGVLTVAEGFGLLGKTIGATAAAIASGNWSGLREEIGKMAQESAANIDALASKTATAKVAQSAFGQSVAESGAQAAAASPKYLQIQAAYDEVTKAAAKYTTLVQKAAEARAAEADTANTLASSFGTEIDQRRVAAEQAAVQADALRRLAEAKDAEAKIAASQVAATQAEADAAVAAGEKISQAKQDEIQKLKESAAAKAEDAAKALAAAEAAKIHAAATETATLAFADNSKRVSELRAAWQEAQVAATVLHAELAAGRATRQQVIEADTAAGQAARLYRDSLADTTAAIQARAAVERGAINVQERGRSLQLEVIQTQIEVARARGRDNEVTQLQIEYARVQMELHALKAKALRAEADAQLALIAAKRSELEASGQLTEVKRLELAAAEASARAKKVDADIADQLASRARQLKDVVRATGDAMDSASGQADKLGNSWDSAADKADRYSASAAKAAKASDPNVVQREVRSAEVNTDYMAAQAGLNAAEAAKLREIYSYYATMANAEAAGRASASQGLLFNTSDYAAVTREYADKAIAEARRQVAEEAQKSASAAGTSTQSPSNGFMYGAPRGTYTVNINTSSGTKTVTTTDQSSANNVVQALQELAARS